MTDKEFVSFYKDYVDTVKRFNIDTTNKCPLECPFCNRQRTDMGAKSIIRQSYDMPIENVEKLLRKADSLGFCGTYSDPIYHPKFLDILRVIREYKHKSFNIHTNGTRKSLSWWKEAYSLTNKHNTTWIFGLDGTDQETANKYRVNTRYDEVFSVMKLGASMGVKVAWQFIVFRHNEHQIEEVKRLSQEIGVTLRLMFSCRFRNDKEMEESGVYPPTNEKYYSRMAKDKVINFLPRILK